VGWDHDVVFAARYDAKSIRLFQVATVLTLKETSSSFDHGIRGRAFIMCVVQYSGIRRRRASIGRWRVRMIRHRSWHLQPMAIIHNGNNVLRTGISEDQMVRDTCKFYIARLKPNISRRSNEKQKMGGFRGAVPARNIACRA
jgi:hypothetical protein